MTTSIPAATQLRVALDDIRLRSNVRDLVEDDVDALAQSIALCGLLVPVIVRPVDEGYDLVAGYHRVAAPGRTPRPSPSVLHMAFTRRRERGYVSHDAQESVRTAGKRGGAPEPRA